MDKLIVTRKDHECDYCGTTIEAGNYSNFMSFREPRFADDHETQIGIEYVKLYLCEKTDDCIQRTETEHNQ